MARVRRCDLPSAGIFHITSRGVNRCAIYLDELDHLFFLEHLRDAVVREELHCHAYCLMPNHFHVVLEGRMSAISNAMYRVVGTHARRFNKRYKRSGHLFQGRFHAQVIRNDKHLAKAITYVVNNPVRHRMCAQADDWRWGGTALLEAALLEAALLEAALAEAG